MAPGCCGSPRSSGNPAFTVAKSSSMAALIAGSSTPWSARKTMVPDAPPAPSSAKYWSSTSKPSALSEAGMSVDASYDGPDRSRRADHGDEGGEPEADGGLAVVETPGTDAGKEARIAHPSEGAPPGSERGRDPLVFRLSIAETGLHRDTTERGTWQRCRFGSLVAWRLRPTTANPSMSVRPSAGPCWPCSPCRPDQRSRSRASWRWCGASGRRALPTRHSSPM